LSGEAAFQAEFHHYLREVIGNGYNVNGVVFDRVEFERRVDSGRADIVIASRGKPFIVIETKRESRGRVVREIDPLKPGCYCPSYRLCIAFRSSVYCYG